jgi:hypothetical protein
VLIAKANVNKEINSCIIDGKFYVNEVEFIFYFSSVMLTFNAIYY